MLSKWGLIFLLLWIYPIFFYTILISEFLSLIVGQNNGFNNYRLIFDNCLEGQNSSVDIYFVVTNKSRNNSHLIDLDKLDYLCM
jgi:hypothetical protein